jgi:hypothetical protein
MVNSLAFCRSRQAFACGVIVSLAGTNNVGTHRMRLFQIRYPKLRWFYFSLCFLGGIDEGRGEFFVEGKEVLDALPVVIKGLRPVTEINCPIQYGMGLNQRRWHR